MLGQCIHNDDGTWNFYLVGSAVSKKALIASIVIAMMEAVNLQGLLYWLKSSTSSAQWSIPKWVLATCIHKLYLSLSIKSDPNMQPRVGFLLLGCRSTSHWPTLHTLLYVWVIHPTFMQANRFSSSNEWPMVARGHWNWSTWHAWSCSLLAVVTDRMCTRDHPQRSSKTISIVKQANDLFGLHGYQRWPYKHPS